MGVLGAQALPPCARREIESQAQLVEALTFSPRGGVAPDLGAAAIASLGQPVVGWALDIAGDTMGRYPLEVRAAAFQVLRYARWRRAVPRLVALAQPFRSPWVQWHGALYALASYPYPELAPFWRDLLTFPRRTVREVALRGLTQTGDKHDVLLIREETRRERDAYMARLVARAESLLVRPIAVRDTARFAWPPDSTGRFVPSGSWVKMAVPVLCAAASGRRER